MCHRHASPKEVVKTIRKPLLHATEHITEERIANSEIALYLRTWVAAPNLEVV